MARSLMVAMMCAVAAGLFAAPAESCSCAGFSSTPDALQSTRTVVFLGTVESIEPPRVRCTWSTDGMGSCVAGGGPTGVTFSVTTMFRGPALQQIALKGDGSNCDYAFELHHSYLVYAYARDNDMMEASKCSRTRPLAAATEDLKYLEGLRDGRAQVVIHGEVLRRGLDKDGQFQLYGWPKPCELQVFAMSQGVLFSTATDPSGAYQIVLPPGSIQIWVEQAGERLSTTDTLVLENGTSRQHAMRVDLPAPL
jgi:hypothetical protein